MQHVYNTEYVTYNIFKYYDSIIQISFAEIIIFNINFRDNVKITQ